MFTKNLIYLAIMVFALLFLPACGQVSIGIETPRSEGQAPGQGSEIEASQTPEQTEAAVVETLLPTSTPEPSPYWVEVQDPQYGVRYAVPCFWLVNFPPDYGPGSGAQSYSIRNYPDEYVLTFPHGQGIWEAGGIKIDMNFMDSATWGIAPGASLIDFANGLYPQDSETRLVSTEELKINGQPALRVVTENTFGTGQFYLMAVSETIYLIFAPNPEAVANSDVLAILNSIAISSDIAVQVPTIQPGPPPEGLVASCLEYPVEPNTFSEIPTEPDCQAVTPDKPEWTACNVQLGIQSRNLSALLGYMVDPFQIGYWGSEGRTDSPEAILEELQSVRLPQEPSIAPTFTVNRDLFPPLNGQDPEALLGPDVNPVQVIYSEGWGKDREGSALLYFIENEAGEIKWYGLIFSPQHFDK